MSRIGGVIRSANTKAITPPKLMPPFQRTAASGALPTGQTKLSKATSGPITAPPIGPPSPGPGGEVADGAEEAEQGDGRPDHRPQDRPRLAVPGEEEAAPPRLGHPGGEGARGEEADDDVAHDRRPLHDVDVRGRGEAGRRAQA